MIKGVPTRRASGRRLGAHGVIQAGSPGLGTVAALITNGSTEQLTHHFARGKENGLTEVELKEVIIHLAFHACWPRAMSATTVGRGVFGA